MKDFGLYIMFALFSVLFSTFMGIAINQHDAVKTECARYHPVTGDFEWVKK
jgi:hypothetical protein